MRATINGRNVIRNFQYVVQFGSIFECYPFDDDADFRLIFDIQLHCNSSDETQQMYIEADTNINTSRLVLRSFYNGFELAIANRIPIVFALDEQRRPIEGNFHVRCIGPIDAFTTIIFGTVLEAI